MKVFRKKNYLQIDFSNGHCYSTNECTDDMWNFIIANQDDETKIMKEFVSEDIYSGKILLEKVQKSKILTIRGASVYMESVSELSIPQDFVANIIEAEEAGDTAELQKFKNFWTLVSLNPDSRVRNNLFWFIRKWNMQITESGLIIAYRNADIKEEAKWSTEDVKTIINTYYKQKCLNKNNPYEIMIEIQGTMCNLGEAYDEVVNGGNSPVYTDQHSHSTEIRLGQPVRIPREECDANQEHSCSKGLHTGAKGWLKQNYFGSVGLMVLVNPAHVVAVPTIDDYGKMRTCEYFPIAIIDFDDKGNIIEKTYSLHDDIAYLQNQKYEGTINNMDIDNYTLNGAFMSREDMYNSILASLNK